MVTADVMRCRQDGPMRYQLARRRSRLLQPPSVLASNIISCGSWGALLVLVISAPPPAYTGTCMVVPSVHLHQDDVGDGARAWLSDPGFPTHSKLRAGTDSTSDPSSSALENRENVNCIITEKAQRLQNLRETKARTSRFEPAQQIRPAAFLTRLCSHRTPIILEPTRVLTPPTASSDGNFGESAIRGIGVPSFDSSVV